MVHRNKVLVEHQHRLPRPSRLCMGIQQGSTFYVRQRQTVSESQSHLSSYLITDYCMDLKIPNASVNLRSVPFDSIWRATCLEESGYICPLQRVVG